jgi:hypothetical protein
MSYKKGQSGNLAGRPKGALNKMSTEQRDYLRKFLLQNKAKFEEHLQKLKAKDFVQTYIALMQYTLPKPATTEIKEVSELEAFIAMTPEERLAIIEEIQESQRNNIR